MPAVTTPTLERIMDLEAERAQLYARFGERRYLDRRERERLIRIRADLAQLWELRRQERAGAPEGAMPDNLRGAGEFGARDGRHNRSRRRPGRTWAEALLELEVG